MSKINFFCVFVLILAITGCSDFSTKETLFNGEILVDYTGGWYLGAQDDLALHFYKETQVYKVSFLGRKGYKYPKDTLITIMFPKVVIMKNIKPEFELIIVNQETGGSESIKLP